LYPVYSFQEYKRRGTFYNYLNGFDWRIFDRFFIENFVTHQL